ncbi:hypothetical protein [Bradyrhizobium sp. Arg816]|nr:hypothetical protein [Bradyrhizobium sp. Arg816]MDI3567555.1 hypothetical protein [Bradyrhizobium sp. Arg816]
MHADNACDDEGDLVVDLLNYDRRRLVELDFIDPAENILFIRRRCAFLL